MSRVVLNDYINAGLCAIFMFVVVSIVVFGLKSVQRARAENKPTSRETPRRRMLFGNMSSAAGAAGRYLGQTLRLMVGVPDYETYVEHMRRTHPDQEPMTYRSEERRVS
ncbi:hypothetical protein G6F35_017683 [Rhizopus arrhizus]|nr:hypothetical protein G6F35_017683 [Rhizopus arrhizus]